VEFDAPPAVRRDVAEKQLRAGLRKKAEGVKLAMMAPLQLRQVAVLADGALAAVIGVPRESEVGWRRMSTTTSTRGVSTRVRAAVVDGGYGGAARAGPRQRSRAAVFGDAVVILAAGARSGGGGSTSCLGGLEARLARLLEVSEVRQQNAALRDVLQEPRREDDVVRRKMVEAGESMAHDPSKAAARLRSSSPTQTGPIDADGDVAMAEDPDSKRRSQTEVLPAMASPEELRVGTWNTFHRGCGEGSCCGLWRSFGGRESARHCCHRRCCWGTSPAR